MAQEHERWVVQAGRTEWGITIAHYLGDCHWGTICIGTREWMKPLVENPDAHHARVARFKSRAAAEEAVERLKKEEQ